MNGWSHPNALHLSPVWAPPPPGVIFPPRFPPGGPSLPPPPPPHVASSVRQPPTSTRGPAPSSADPPFPSTQPGAAGAHTPTWRCHLSLSVFTWAMRCLRRWLIGQLFFSKVCSNQDDVFDDDEKPTAIIRPLCLIDIYVSFFFFFFTVTLAGLHHQPAVMFVKNILLLQRQRAAVWALLCDFRGRRWAA